MIMDDEINPKFLTKEYIKDLLFKKPTKEEIDNATKQSLAPLRMAGNGFSSGEPGGKYRLGPIS